MELASGGREAKQGENDVDEVRASVLNEDVFG